MSTIGQVERRTQQRVVKLFRDTLKYDYLGDWTDRVGNRNVDENLLRTFLREQQGYDEALITRALHLLDKAAGDSSKSLYDRIQAEVSEKVSAFDDMSLVQLIVERGVNAVGALPESIRKNREAAAETIENNVRRLIIDESPINPKYYEKMSELLDALIQQRRQEAGDYAEYLAKIVELTRQAKSGPAAAAYPSALDTSAKRALYDNLQQNEALALAVNTGVRANRQDDWRNNPVKVKKVRNAIREALLSSAALPSKPTPNATGNIGREQPAVYIADSEAKKLEELLDEILSLVKSQHEY